MLTKDQKKPHNQTPKKPNQPQTLEKERKKKKGRKNRQKEKVALKLLPTTSTIAKVREEDMHQN